MKDGSSRVLSLRALQRLLGRVRRGKSVVLTNGVFDLLHVGHVSYLEKARARGDLLIVAVNGDASVRALKGPSRPIHPARARARVLASLRSVDYAVIFPGKRVTAVIRALSPDVYVKGGDYTPSTLNREEKRALDQVGAKIRIIPFVKGYSTTQTIRKLCGEK